MGRVLRTADTSSRARGECICMCTHRAPHRVCVCVCVCVCEMYVLLQIRESGVITVLAVHGDPLLARRGDSIHGVTPRLARHQNGDGCDSCSRSSCSISHCRFSQCLYDVRSGAFRHRLILHGHMRTIGCTAARIGAALHPFVRRRRRRTRSGRLLMPTLRAPLLLPGSGPTRLVHVVIRFAIVRRAFGRHVVILHLPESTTKIHLDPEE